MFFHNMSLDVRINNKYFLNWTEDYFLHIWSFLNAILFKMRQKAVKRHCQHIFFNKLIFSLPPPPFNPTIYLSISFSLSFYLFSLSTLFSLPILSCILIAKNVTEITSYCVDKFLWRINVILFSRLKRLVAPKFCFNDAL